MCIDYCLYIKRIQDLATIYIKNREVLKNRDDTKFNVQEEINNFNNIVIEEDDIVNIYCSQEKANDYENIINFLKENINDFKNHIRINIENSNIKREYISCGDGECQFANRCNNCDTEYCEVCMFNTGATTRDFFEADCKENEMIDKERDMIES